MLAKKPLLQALGILALGCLSQAAQAQAPLDQTIGLLQERIAAVSHGSPCGGYSPVDRPMGFGGNNFVFRPPASDRQIVVTSASDSAPPHALQEGTLRWAVAKARREGGGRIRFDRGAMKGTQIVLRTPLALPSDTVVDGECSGVTIAGEQKTLLFAIHDVRNVVVRGLSFRKTDYDPNSETGRDAIMVYGDFSGIWIDRNTFRQCGDGCIDVVRFQSGAITISRNLFMEHNKVALFFNAPCKGDDAAKGIACSLPHDARHPTAAKARITMFNNVFWATGQRHPKVAADAYVHAINNLVAYRSAVYQGGKTGASYGILASDGASLLAENNIFIDLNRRDRSTALAPAIQNGAKIEPRELGFVRSRGNVAMNGGAIVDRLPDTVPRPDYAVMPEKRDLSPANARNDALCIVGRLRASTCTD